MTEEKYNIIESFQTTYETWVDMYKELIWEDPPDPYPEDKEETGVTRDGVPLTFFRWKNSYCFYIDKELLVYNEKSKICRVL